MASDFRVAAYQEACKCLKIASGLTDKDSLMWANLLGGIANLMVASVPDDVVQGAAAYEEQRRARNERLRRHFDDVFTR